MRLVKDCDVFAQQRQCAIFFNLRQTRRKLDKCEKIIEYINSEITCLFPKSLYENPDIFNSREEMYNNSRKNTFVSMCLKHSEQKCLCKQTNKQCKITGIIDLSRFSDKEYVEKLYKDGVLDGIYNIMQSITQSLKSSTGFNNFIK